MTPPSLGNSKCSRISSLVTPLVCFTSSQRLYVGGGQFASKGDYRHMLNGPVPIYIE